MIIGVLKEQTDARVSITPETTKKLIDKENQVLVEKGAGAGAMLSDADYQEAGAQLAEQAEILSSADIIISIHPPSWDKLSKLPKGKIVISLFNPLGDKELADKLVTSDIIPFSLDRIPRTTIAQSMDILSSMASIAGYKAVLTAANHLPSHFPMLMTAAGTIPPARVLILGAGVAGLQAIATARRLGAIVEAFDVRSAAREEVESLGAKFVEVEGAQEDLAAGGYAITQTEEYQNRQKALIHEKASKAHVIITTANIPGRKAPILIEKATVEAMQPGSVIVDLAAITGGNCELTENDKTIVRNGVTIIGNSNLPGEVSKDASKMYSNNVLNFFNYVFKDGIEGIDYSNEIVAGTYFGKPKAEANTND
ncbi:MAG: NAD(P) transhydrogenase subunit alpha [Bacteroidetes bacterium]|nr:NAD(P) transhydrogenase subunit alpha [Bacteroidota bacterium]